MTEIAYDGCVWPLDIQCLTDEWENFSDAVKTRAAGLASDTLHRLTAYRVGGCPITVRPCAPAGSFGSAFHAALMGGREWGPINNGGTWSNYVCGGACESGCEIQLPGPIGRVDEVKVDGIVLDPGLYSVNDDRIVYMGDGECPFPSTQNFGLPDTEPGTFSITYLNAYPVDQQGAAAAASLALEFAKACANGKCRLPTGVTNIVRQGVAMQITPGAFPDGLTGLREVDTYIGLWNPDGRTRQSTVWSPDIRRPRVVR